MPYTGLKPAGLDWGPVVPRADKAVATGDVSEVLHLLLDTTEATLREKFALAMARRRYDENDVAAAREYVQAMLGFVLYSHHLYTFLINGEAHGEGSPAEHPD